MAKQGVDLPATGEYGVGMLFLPQDPVDRVVCENLLRELVIREGQVVLGWRDVPVDSSCLGESVTSIEPVIRQLFIGRGKDTPDSDTFERKLYVIRKQAHTQMAIRAPWVIENGTFYIPTLSARTITYKGMVLAENLSTYYLDLADARTESALALIHQRFSTNTSPSWRLAHPFAISATTARSTRSRGTSTG